jgi:hypothetical protein
MSPIRRAARGIVRLIAVGLILIGGLSVGVEFASHRLRGTDIHVGRCILWAVPVLIGTLVLFKSTTIAARLTEDLDDES